MNEEDKLKVQVATADGKSMQQVKAKAWLYHIQGLLLTDVGQYGKAMESFKIALTYEPGFELAKLADAAAQEKSKNTGKQ